MEDTITQQIKMAFPNFFQQIMFLLAESLLPFIRNELQKLIEETGQKTEFRKNN
jgi:hypothetical protein